jgi:NAD-dependent SIR2 family protein deacetylase
MRDPIEEAAGAVGAATAMVITAGAGMGVDSGLPDFRGDEGFWKAYPPYRQLGLDFAALANPRWFDTDPAFAWGFYGHRQALYRATTPHAGFAILRAWAEAKPQGAFVFTSNVDGQFQRAGFGEERVHECHGAIAFRQCTRRCGAGIFPAGPDEVEVDPVSFCATGELPRCRCGAPARPNILMFGDRDWDSRRSDAQAARLEDWLETAERLVVVECGAGTAIPTVRRFGEALAAERGARLIRINAREPEVPDGQIGLAMGARAALEAIVARMP